MKENTITTYSCEICGTAYDSKKYAELCEQEGIPKNLNKFIGKWILVPTQVLINRNTEESSYVDWNIKWNIMRIDSNHVKPLAPPLVQNMLLKVKKIGHRVVYKGIAFYPNSYVFDSLMDRALEIPESISSGILENYLKLHSNHSSMSQDDFHKILFSESQKYIQKISSEMGVEISDSDFDGYQLEGLNNVSNQFNN